MASRRKKLALTLSVVVIAGVFFVRSKPLIDPAARGLPPFVNEGQVLARFTGPEYQGRPQYETVVLYLPMSQAEVEKEFDALRARDAQWIVKRFPTGNTSYLRIGRELNSINVSLRSGKHETRSPYAEVLPRVLDPKGTTVWIQQGQSPESLIDRLMAKLRRP